MYEVFVSFVICLAAQPGVCKDETLVWTSDQNLTPQSCMMQSMPRIAEWYDKNKSWAHKWTVQKFGCRTKPVVEA